MISGVRAARVALAVQARATSTRLPGKVLVPNIGRPLLAYELERLRDVAGATSRVVATTTNDSDDAIARVAAAEGFVVVRGSEFDVLDRFVQAARFVGADVIVRVTADCPLIDPCVVDDVIGRYLAGGADYVSNTLERTYPRGLGDDVAPPIGGAGTSRAVRSRTNGGLFACPDRRISPGHRWILATYQLRN